MGIAWKDKLSRALWAYRTASKTPLGMSPYQLIYEKTCYLPVELEFKAHWAIKRWNMDFEAARKKKLQLSELEEWQEKAYHNAKLYKERIKIWHDKRSKKKEFKPGDIGNSRVKLFGHRKLRSKLKGPYKVISTSSHVAVTFQNDRYAFQGKWSSFKSFP
jgi:hypothetical protein